MNIAVTNHAVERYQERVESAAKLDKEAVRTIIRILVEEALANGTVQDHPEYSARRVIPFGAGGDQLFLSIGPNETSYPGDIAVIGVQYEKELGIGKSSIGATLGDIVPAETKKNLAEVVKTPVKNKYIVRVGGKSETYDVKDDEDLVDFLQRRRPNPDDVEVFERKEITIRQVYVVEKPKKT